MSRAKIAPRGSAAWLLKRVEKGLDGDRFPNVVEIRGLCAALRMALQTIDTQAGMLAELRRAAPRGNRRKP